MRQERRQSNGLFNPTNAMYRRFLTGFGGGGVGGRNVGGVPLQAAHQALAVRNVEVVTVHRGVCTGQHRPAAGNPDTTSG